jgi:hypothetical protein
VLDRHRFVGMGCSGKASLHLGYDEDAPDSARCLFSNRLVVPSNGSRNDQSLPLQISAGQPDGASAAASGG